MEQYKKRIIKLFKSTKRLEEIDELFEERIKNMDCIVTYEPSKTCITIPKNVDTLLPLMHIEWNDEHVTNNKIKIKVLTKEYVINFLTLDDKSEFLYLLYELKELVQYPMTNFIVDGAYKVVKTSYGYHLSLTDEPKFTLEALEAFVKETFDKPVFYKLTLEDIMCVDNAKVVKQIQIFTRLFE